MKGIILTAGASTRLFPSTLITSKQLLPVYDRPMIFYPLNTLISSGVKDILVIVSPEYSGHFITLLGSILEKYKIQISFKVQAEPRGIPEAFLLGENHIDQNNVALILGDNIFENNFSDEMKNFKSGGHIFVKKVPDPERYGVVELNSEKIPQQIVEKPKEWISDFAISGLYLCDYHAIEAAKNLSPSGRGEMEITDIVNYYLEKKELGVSIFEGEYLDAGTHDSLLEASILVRDKELTKNFDPTLEEAINEYGIKRKEIIKKKLI